LAYIMRVEVETYQISKTKIRTNNMKKYCKKFLLNLIEVLKYISSIKNVINHSKKV